MLNNYQKKDKTLMRTLYLLVFVDVVEQVTKQLIPPFRPDIPSEIGDNRGILRLMKMCWDNDPLMRPTFSEIKSKLKSLTHVK